MTTISSSALYGQQDNARGLLPEVLGGFERLREKGREQGLELTIISAYRSFDRQLMIWNRKAAGKLSVFDDEGKPLPMATMSDKEKVFAILRWSALPGASRHHWQTDCDVYDSAAVDENYSVRLTQEESRTTFSRLHNWLDDLMGADRAEGFYRPYNRERGGVAPEPWHISYRPLSEQFEQAHSLAGLEAVLKTADIELKRAVLENLDEIYQRFVRLDP